MSLLSPFKPKRAFKKSNIKKFFLNAAKKALTVVNKDDLLEIELVKQKDYICLLFDSLLMDYVFTDN